MSHKFLRTAGKVVLYLFIALVVCELLLQAAGYVTQKLSARDRLTWFTGNTRILAVGDSNTYGFYVPENQSYPSQLEALWNKKNPKHKIEVINLGYPGATTSMIKESMPKIIKTFRPDVVLLLAGFVDRGALAAESEEKEMGVPQKLLMAFKKYSRIYKAYSMLTKGKFNSALLNKGERSDVFTLSDDEIKYIQSHSSVSPDDFVNILKSNNTKSPEYNNVRQIAEKLITDRMKNKTYATPSGETAPGISYGDEKFNLGEAQHYGVGESLERIDGNIKAIHELLATENIDLYLLTYGASWGWQSSVNAVIRESAGKQQIPLINTSSRLYELCNHTFPCTDYFFEDYHLNKNGYVIFAEDVSKGLEKYLSIDTPNTQQPRP